MQEYQLKTEYIELVKLLKLLGIAATGGHAKIMVDEGEVRVNNKPETRKRAKLSQGDIVEVNGETIHIK
ncbi:MAG TPA: RNA-binding S4 domain-containing protein [Prolixibacteraceae bacterium]|nr:RNA-binding S4 domain-containing protein [Prolixibacteraceae bacterium]